MKLPGWLRQEADTIGRAVFWIVGLGVIYLAFLYCDRFILDQAHALFGEAISSNWVVALIFEGIEIFSALGVAIGYLIHTIAVLWVLLRHL